MLEPGGLGLVSDIIGSRSRLGSLRVSSRSRLGLKDECLGLVSVSGAEVSVLVSVSDRRVSGASLRSTNYFRVFCHSSTVAQYSSFCSNISLSDIDCISDTYQTRLRKRCARRFASLSRFPASVGHECCCQVDRRHTAL